MRAGVLNQEDLASLRTQAVLAEAPVMDLVRIDGSPQPLVAVYNWVMPLECFVVICFWCLSGTKMYHQKLNNHDLDNVLESMNSKHAFMRKGNNIPCLVYLNNRIQAELLAHKQTDGQVLYKHLENILEEAQRLGCSPILD